METKSIVAVLASLASAPLLHGCDKAQSQVTNVPDHAQTRSKDEAEHACGNHAEGACGAATPDDASSRELERTFEISTDGFAEVNIKMPAGAKFSVEFEGGTPELTWNVHSHDHSGNTQVHDSGTGGDGQVEFGAHEDGIFSVLWKNSSSSNSTLRVRVIVTDGASLHSWVP